MYWAGNKRSHGFTIVELIIVIVVIAILTAVVLVAYNGIQNRAKDSSVQSTLRQIVNKIAVYRQDNESYPASISAIALPTLSNGHAVTYTSTDTSKGFCASVTLENIKYYYSTLSGKSFAGSCGPESCPAGFIPVPGNALLGTSDFCIMKHEAKIVGQSNGVQSYNSSFVPESRASGTAWTNISRNNAVSESTTACSGCHLVTEAEWLTIAANVLTVDSNWSGGIVGSGYIYNGHGNNNPAAALAASTDDTDGMFGITGGTGNGAQYNNRRTLTLSNHEVIWDFVGNTWEWTSETMTGAQPGAAGSSWRQYTAISNWGNLPTSSRPSVLASTPGLSSVASWNSSQGVGQIRSNLSEAGTKAFRRSGGYADAASGGVLAVSLEAAVTDTFGNYGFRVSK